MLDKTSSDELLMKKLMIWEGTGKEVIKDVIEEVIRDVWESFSLVERTSLAGCRRYKRKSHIVLCEHFRGAKLVILKLLVYWKLEKR